MRDDAIGEIREAGAELHELIDHLRARVDHVDEPQVKALFENTATTLLGLEQAFADYEHQLEQTVKSWER